MLIDAGAQDDEDVDGLVDFITSVFDARPELDSTLQAVYVTHNHIDHNPGAGTSRRGERNLPDATGLAPVV